MWSLGALWLLGSGCASERHERAPVTPQRPTVSSDTSTTHAQTFELEAGVAYDPGDSFDSPVTLKYGLDETTELFSGWSPSQWVDIPGNDGYGVGDVTLGLRHRFVEELDLRPSAAVQLVGQLPVADPDDGVGSGEPALYAAAIATKNIGSVAATAFYQIGLLAEPDGAGVDVQHTVTGAASVPLAGPWSAFGEVAGIFQVEGNDSPVFTTLGVAHGFEPWLVADASVVVGLNDDANDLVFQLGFTMNFGGVATDIHGH